MTVKNHISLISKRMSNIQHMLLCYSKEGRLLLCQKAREDRWANLFIVVGLYGKHLQLLVLLGLYSVVSKLPWYWRWRSVLHLKCSEKWLIEQPLYDRRINFPMIILGVIAGILLAVGLLPPYIEMWKRRGRVIGINWVCTPTGQILALLTQLDFSHHRLDGSLLLINGPR